MEKLPFFKIIKISIVFVVIGSVLYVYYALDPIRDSIFPPCMFHQLTGFYCPGCGTQRALHSILHGKILSGVILNPLPVLLLFLIILFYIKNRYNMYNKSFLTGMQSKIIVIVVMLYTVIRNMFNF
ncbi:MAG: DUF2752 domain-containing protein [Candidatus Delongbacteria bacterium]|nr:DUF2752 domain-containing protein [Candidatus Delongbacteria bacterium]MBN2835437.1 DUF2752 domain-containing protein [Candidatus Delongbacteria bacterium]